MSSSVRTRDVQLDQPQRRPGARLIEGLAIASAALLWAALACRVLAALLTLAGAYRGPLIVGLLGSAAGVLCADALSGLVHFACDRFFSERTPLIGSAFIAPFREHHRDPQGIVRHGLCERSGNGCIALLPVLAVLHACFVADPNRLGWWLQQALVLALCAALAATNELHALAHRAQVSASIRALQRLGFILSPEAHFRHHSGAHDRAYCIATGWLNPWLDRLRVFHALERGLRRLAHASKRLTGF